MDSVKLKSLRVIRVFRPFKTINVIPSKKNQSLNWWYRYEEAYLGFDLIATWVRKCRSFLVVCLCPVRHDGPSHLQRRLVQHMPVLRNPYHQQWNKWSELALRLGDQSSLLEVWPRQLWVPLGDVLWKSKWIYRDSEFDSRQRQDHG